MKKKKCLPEDDPTEISKNKNEQTQEHEGSQIPVKLESLEEIEKKVKKEIKKRKADEKPKKFYSFFAAAVAVSVFLYSVDILCFDPPFSRVALIDLLDLLWQNLSTVLAITVALSLVALQLASQTYSPRTIRYFVDPRVNISFLTLISFFLLSLIYIFCLRVSISSMLLNERGIQEATFAALCLFILCYIFLGGYAIFAIQRLQPEVFIRSILSKVDKKFIEEISRSYKGERLITISSENDVLLVIEDLFGKSMIEGREMIARSCSFELGFTILILMEKGIINVKNEKAVSDYFFLYFYKMGNKAFAVQSDNVLEILVIQISRIVRLGCELGFYSFYCSGIGFFDSLLKEIKRCGDSCKFQVYISSERYDIEDFLLEFKSKIEEMAKKSQT